LFYAAIDIAPLDDDVLPLNVAFVLHTVEQRVFKVTTRSVGTPHKVADMFRFLGSLYFGGRERGD
jgi:hypothetical protein